MAEPKFKVGDRVRFLNNCGVVTVVDTGVKTWGGQFITVIWDPMPVMVHISNLELEEKK
jgi:hypothetical protein